MMYGIRIPICLQSLVWLKMAYEQPFFVRFDKLDSFDYCLNSYHLVLHSVRRYIAISEMLYVNEIHCCVYGWHQ